ncbi:hypothetical protein BDR26DRAFT_690466 [Obelidium mucronatum]|nr:hypothetical protein BDR26DRAFT_690466 [Obelidium mucronatum]
MRRSQAMFSPSAATTFLWARLAILTRDALAAGLYFSHYADYTFAYAHDSTARPIKAGEKGTVIMFNVLLGRTYRVQNLALVASKVDGYDSIVSPNECEWIIFDNSQCLPVYVFEFEAEHSVKPKVGGAWEEGGSHKCELPTAAKKSKKLFLSFHPDSSIFASHIAKLLSATNKADIQIIQGQFKEMDSCDFVIIVLSPKYETSKWHRKEAGYAVMTKKELIPILVDQEGGVVEGDEIPGLSIVGERVVDLRGSKGEDIAARAVARIDEMSLW